MRHCDAAGCVGCSEDENCYAVGGDNTCLVCDPGFTFQANYGDSIIFQRCGGSGLCINNNNPNIDDVAPYANCWAVDELGYCVYCPDGTCGAVSSPTSTPTPSQTSTQTSTPTQTPSNTGFGCVVSRSTGPGVVSFSGGQLYGSFSDPTQSLYGIVSFGATQATPFPGIAGEPWTFVLQSTTQIWVADATALNVAHVYPYTLVGSTWVQGTGVRFFTDPNPCFSITGQVNGDGHWIIVGVTATNGYTVYQYDATTAATTVIYPYP